MTEKLVELYTDGACKGNPGPGGWGALLICGDRKKELHGGELSTTNNRMELTAAIQGLQAINPIFQVRLVTDSKYVQQGIEEWLQNWKRRGWRTASGAPVKNVDLWRLLDEQVARHQIQWQWVKGHSGHAGNERADQLANQGVAEVLSQASKARE